MNHSIVVDQTPQIVSFVWKQQARRPWTIALPAPSPQVSLNNRFPCLNHLWHVEGKCFDYHGQTSKGRFLSIPTQYLSPSGSSERNFERREFWQIMPSERSHGNHHRLVAAASSLRY